MNTFRTHFGLAMLVGETPAGRAQQRGVTKTHETLQTRDLVGVKAAMIALARTNTDLCLSLNFDAITDQVFCESGLANALARNVTTVELFGNNLGDRSCEALAPNLAQSHVTRLKLGDNQIGDDGCEALSMALHGNSQLVQLHLSSNVIGDRGIAALAHALLSNSTLTSLSLRNNKFGAPGVAALSMVLAQPNCNLGELQMKRNLIGPQGAAALALALPFNSSLRVLELESTGLTGPDAGVLAEALRRNRVVHAVNLNDNDVRDEGAAAISNLLSANTVITTVGLRGNSITSSGAVKLAEALYTNTTLTGIDLGFNELGEEGVAVLAEALRVNQHLHSLDVHRNHISCGGIRALAHALVSNSTLRHLDIASNFSRDQGASCWGLLLACNTSLTRLCVTDNEITNAGAADLLRGLQGNTTLCYLGFGGQSVEPPRANTIHGMLRIQLNRKLARNRQLSATPPPDPQLMPPPTPPAPAAPGQPANPPSPLSIASHTPRPMFLPDFSRAGPQAHTHLNFRPPQNPGFSTRRHPRPAPLVAAVPVVVENSPTAVLSSSPGRKESNEPSLAASLRPTPAQRRQLWARCLFPAKSSSDSVPEEVTEVDQTAMVVKDEAVVTYAGDTELQLASASDQTHDYIFGRKSTKATLPEDLIWCDAAKMMQPMSFGVPVEPPAEEDSPHGSPKAFLPLTNSPILTRARSATASTTPGPASPNSTSGPAPGLSRATSMDGVATLWGVSSSASNGTGSELGSEGGGFYSLWAAP